mgnify:CR=1 FL=1
MLSQPESVVNESTIVVSLKYQTPSACTESQAVKVVESSIEVTLFTVISVEEGQRLLGKE